MSTKFRVARVLAVLAPMLPVLEAQVELPRIATPHKYGKYLLSKSDDPKSFDSIYVTSPFVFRHDGRFRMIYSGFDGTGYQTGLAVSDDLVNWERKGLLIGRNAGSDVIDVSIGINSILRDDRIGSEGELKKVNGRYLATFLTFPEVGHEAGPGSIGLAWSDDLENWEVGGIILKPEDGADWEKGGLYKSYIIEHEGTYYVFYNAKDRSKKESKRKKEPWREQTGMATSTDLVHWTRSPLNPVIPNGPEGSPDEKFASDPAVVRDGDTWILYYFGLAADGHARELATTTKDFKTFTKVPDILIDAGPPGSIDDVHAHKPSIISWNGDLYHFYDAVSGRGKKFLERRRGIAVARSRPWETAEPSGETNGDE